MIFIGILLLYFIIKIMTTGSLISSKVLLHFLTSSLSATDLLGDGTIMLDGIISVINILQQNY